MHGPAAVAMTQLRQRRENVGDQAVPVAEDVGAAIGRA
jgi:hypothetical protein